MDLSIGSNLPYSKAAGLAGDKLKAENLQSKLQNKPATDEEMMEVCKSFESYMLEQVFKELKKSVPEDEDRKDPYLEQFGDMLYEEYAKDATKNQGLGIAQMLYEAMKRNM